MHRMRSTTELRLTPGCIEKTLNSSISAAGVQLFVNVCLLEYTVWPTAVHTHMFKQGDNQANVAGSILLDIFTGQRGLLHFQMVQLKLIQNKRHKAGCYTIWRVEPLSGRGDWGVLCGSTVISQELVSVARKTRGGSGISEMYPETRTLLRLQGSETAISISCWQFLKNRSMQTSSGCLMLNK